LKIVFASSIACGSYKYTCAPPAWRAPTMSIEGASRISSVSGLNDRPKTAIFLSLSTHSRSRIFSTKYFF